MRWAENLDGQAITTPVNPEALRDILIECNYDFNKTQYLYQGYKYGFRLGYEGPSTRQAVSENHKLKLGNKTVLWNKLMKEVEAGRVSGPHAKPPQEGSFVQSPIFLVDKDHGTKFRMVFDLSYDHPNGGSINAGIPKDKASVEYSSIDTLIQACLRNENRAPYLSRSDLKNAFRLCPISIPDRRWLVMMAHHPTTDQKFYFTDLNLSFGSSSSCKMFNKMTQALRHIIMTKTGGEVIGYLDDFCFVGKDEESC